MRKVLVKNLLWSFTSAARGPDQCMRNAQSMRNIENKFNFRLLLRFLEKFPCIRCCLNST